MPRSVHLYDRIFSILKSRTSCQTQPISAADFTRKGAEAERRELEDRSGKLLDYLLVEAVVDQTFLLF